MHLAVFLVGHDLGAEILPGLGVALQVEQVVTGQCPVLRIHGTAPLENHSLILSSRRRPGSSAVRGMDPGIRRDDEKLSPG